jgi:thioesterase domain-containing protein/acyl carrier protein
VELGEVEEVLRGHEEVREAAVVVREAEIRETGAGAGVGIAGGEEKRLVGYVVMKEGVRGRSVELRKYVQERLPEYMVPQVIVELEEMPRLGNGKVNRRGLPEPGKERPELEQSYVVPRDRTELEIVNIWERCLDVQPIGIRDNFFALGGSSLSALQCINIMNNQLEVDVPLADLFQYPTVEQLSTIVRKSSELRANRISPVIALQPITTVQKEGASFFYIHPVGGFVTCYLELARLLAGKYAFYGIQSPAVEMGSISSWSVGSVESLASRYIEALKAVEPYGPYHLGGWSFGGTVAFEMARQLQQRGDEIASLALIDAPFYKLQKDDLSSGPSNLAEAECENEEDDAQLLAYLYFGDEHSSALSLPNGTSEERLESLLSQVRHFNIVPREADTAWGKRVAAMVRAHRQAAREYTPLNYQGPVVLFKPQAGEGDTQSLEQRVTRLVEGLKALGASPIDICSVPRLHKTMVFGQGATAIAHWFTERFAVKQVASLNVAAEGTALKG